MLNTYVDDNAIYIHSWFSPFGPILNVKSKTRSGRFYSLVLLFSSRIPGCERDVVPRVWFLLHFPRAIWFQRHCIHPPCGSCGHAMGDYPEWPWASQRKNQDQFEKVSPFTLKCFSGIFFVGSVLEVENASFSAWSKQNCAQPPPWFQSQLCRERPTLFSWSSSPCWRCPGSS